MEAVLGILGWPESEPGTYTGESHLDFNDTTIDVGRRCKQRVYISQPTLTTRKASKNRHHKERPARGIRHNLLSRATRYVVFSQLYYNIAGEELL